MNLKYLLVIVLLLVVDIFAFTEVAQLVRQPSDAAVSVGLLLMAGLVAVNFFVIRYTLSKLDS